MKVRRFKGIKDYGGKLGVVLLFFLFSSSCFPNGNPSKGFSTSGYGFIENKGQIIDQNNKPNPAVLFLLNRPGISVQLRTGGFSYDLYGMSNIVNCQLSTINYNRLDFNLAGSNPDCRISASDPSPEYMNFFTTGSPAEGITGVRNFQTVIYENIYPGIDLVFVTSSETGYKYNFLIHPEGKISDIQMNIAGPDFIQFSGDTLQCMTRIGPVDEVIPGSYLVNGDSKTMIRTHFREINNGVYGFTADGEIPGNSVLVIDPTCIRSWGTYYGGTGSEVEGRCAVDKSGNVFLTGWTESHTNIATSGSYQDTIGGFRDGFLVKFNAAGVRQWATYFGGTGFEWPRSCNIDITGNIYVAGYTTSTSGIASAGAHQTVYGGGGWDCFIEKFNTAGSRLWGTYYGGAQDDENGAVSTDRNGNVFLTGDTHSETGISTPGAYQDTLYLSSVQDAFLAKFDSNGVRQWGTYYGGEFSDGGYSCSTDTLGNVYFTGWTASRTRMATPGAFQTLFGGGSEDGFLAKFTSGGQRLWSTYYGGSNTEDAYECTSDNAGNVCMVGFTQSANGIASPAAHQTVLGGDKDGFIAFFNPGGQRMWGTYYGGTNEDDIFSCTFGASGDLFISGLTASPNNIATLNSYQPVFRGGYADAFLVKFNTAGQRQWGTYFGDSGDDESYSCRYVTDDTLYIAGKTSSSLNIASPDGYQKTKGGSFDDMLIKFIECWPIDAAGPITGPVSVCANSNGVSYSVPQLAHAANYSWSLPPGAVISGGSRSAIIQVDFTSTATSGTIRVKGVNKCGESGDSASLYITVHPRPLPVITGFDTTCTGSGKLYATATGKSNYQWTLTPGGVKTGGGGTSDNTLTVTWNTPGVQTVGVNYTDANGCTALTPAHFNVFLIPSTPVSISINASANNVCAGTLVNFNSLPTNPGNNPQYQWTVNGVNKGTNLQTYNYIPSNGDLVSCTLTSDDTCSSNNPATSNAVTMIVNPILPVSVSITASLNPFCAGIPVTFTANPTHPGNAPMYQWKVNGANAGTNSNTYTYTPLNGDVVICVLNSSELCTSGNPATSNAITMIVNNNLPAGVSITAIPNPFCPGNPVTFTATPTNQGTAPVYSWKVNGNNAGPNALVYTFNPANNDSVRCVMTSNLNCVTQNPATSNKIIMNGNLAPVVTFTPCFDTITTINAKPIKLKGGIPLGGTYSGPGVTNGYFYPNLAGTGTKTITYTYTNAASCAAAKQLLIINYSLLILNCGQPLTDIRDGKSYATVLIGAQCWMAENLDFGTEISETLPQRDNCIPEKYIHQSSIVTRQSFYQWDELMCYDDTPAQQGLCPPGWHVPDEADWNTLFSYYITSGFAGSPLKYTGYSGFNALLNGANHFNRQWDFIDFATFFWSSTPDGPNKAWAHGMNDLNPSVSFYPSSRANALNVRCVMD